MLCQSPIKDNDLSEVAEDDVVAFEVTMYDAAGMGVGNCIANGGERREQSDKFQRIVSTIKPITVVRASRVAQRAAPDKTHGVEGRTFPAAKFVDRHDARVFELTGEPCFTEEALDRLAIAGVFRQQFFDCHVPIELVISG